MPTSMATLSCTFTEASVSSQTAKRLGQSVGHGVAHRCASWLNIAVCCAVAWAKRLAYCFASWYKFGTVTAWCSQA